MQTRLLGRSELSLPVVVLGGLFREPERRGAEIERALDAALDHGINAIDTAPLYDFGAAEALLGRWLAGRREKVVLLGKVGLRWERAEGDLHFETIFEGKPRSVRKDSRPESVRRDVEESLVRLRTDHLDLVQIHQRDERVPLADTMGELDRLRAEGKVRAIGVSNFEKRDLLEADAVTVTLSGGAFVSVQSPLSLIDRHAESSVLPWARERGCGFLAYSPLARGLLVGRGGAAAAPIRDSRLQDPRFQPGNRRTINAAVGDVLQPMADRYGVSLSTLALAWVIAQPGVTSALVGAQTEDQVRDAVQGGVLRLEPPDQALLNSLSHTLKLDRSEGRPLVERVKGRLRRLAARFSP